MADLVLPQPGLLALGTPNQSFLELDLIEPRPTNAQVLDAIRTLEQSLQTGQGSNLSIGIRPSLWRAARPDACPPDVQDFDVPIVGDDGFTMPATQHDLVVWIGSGRHDTDFDEGMRALSVLSPVAKLAHENKGWNYHGNIDLTGFVDGTENPHLSEAASVALVPSGPGIGSSVLLLQAWRHDMAAWEAAGVPTQEKAIGRTKAGDVEFDPKPAGAHNARTDQDVCGKILRKNIPIGGVADPGTLFIGLRAKQSVLQEMLLRMAGQNGEPRDDLTRYTRAETGAYYVLPASNDLL